MKTIADLLSLKHTTNDTYDNEYKHLIRVGEEAIINSDEPAIATILKDYDKEAQVFFLLQLGSYVERILGLKVADLITQHPDDLVNRVKHEHEADIEPREYFVTLVEREHKD